MILQKILFFAMLYAVAAMAQVDERASLSLSTGFIQQENVALHNQYRGINVKNAKQCKRKCQLEDDICTGFMFLNQTDADGNNCFLFVDEMYYAELVVGSSSYLRNGTTLKKLVKFYSDVRLYSSAPMSNSVKRTIDKCWMSCQNKTGECVAISYDQDNSRCHEFAANQYLTQKKSVLNFTTIAYVDEPVMNYAMYLKKDIKLNNAIFVSPATMTSEITERKCFEACKRIPGCDSFSFSLTSRQCQLANTATTFATEDADSTSFFVNEFNNTIPQVKVYPAVRLLNSFGLVLNQTSAESCWIECQQTRGCVAISYSLDGPEDQTKCYKFKRSVYTVDSDAHYVTYALKSQADVIEAV